jgi:hypothetical protein
MIETAVPHATQKVIHALVRAVAAMFHNGCASSVRVHARLDDLAHACVVVHVSEHEAVDASVPVPADSAVVAWCAATAKTRSTHAALAAFVTQVRSASSIYSIRLQTADSVCRLALLRQVLPCWAPHEDGVAALRPAYGEQLQLPFARSARDDVCSDGELLPWRPTQSPFWPALSRHDQCVQHAQRVMTCAAFADALCLSTSGTLLWCKGRGMLVWRVAPDTCDTSWTLLLGHVDSEDTRASCAALAPLLQHACDTVASTDDTDMTATFEAAAPDGRARIVLKVFARTPAVADARSPGVEWATLFGRRVPDALVLHIDALTPMAVRAQLALSVSTCLRALNAKRRQVLVQVNGPLQTAILCLDNAAPTSDSISAYIGKSILEQT